MKNKLFMFVLLVLLTGTKVFSQDEYLGVIKLFAGTYAPYVYMNCEGQLLQIQQYQALYAVIGNTYGGNGTTNFALPDLRGRIPVGIGNGPGLTPRTQGETGGVEKVTLTSNQMPAHSHTATVNVNAKEEANTDNPTDSYPAGTGAVSYGTTSDVQMNSNTTQVTINPEGGNTSHNNMQPYVGLRYIICVEGLFPPRD